MNVRIRTRLWEDALGKAGAILAKSPMNAMGRSRDWRGLGKADVEAAAAGFAVLDADGAGVGFDGPFCDGEAEAGAAALARAAFVDAIKAVEDAGLLFDGYAGALIENGDFRGLAVDGRDFDTDFGLWRRVFDGVIDDIENGLTEDAAVGVDGDLAAAIDADGLVFVFGEDADDVDDFLNEVDEGEGAEVEGELAAVGAGDGEQAVDEVGEAAHFFEHAADDFAVLLH